MCDNENALLILDTWSIDKLSSRHKNADIISAVLRLRDTLPIQITTERIPSHQDKLTPVAQLPPEVQLNILVDDSAKSYALRMINGNRP